MENDYIKKDTKVLWLRDSKNSVVDFAHIKSIKNDDITIEWYEGHELKKEKITEKQILAIEDKNSGLDIELGGYTGKGLLTKAGYEYVGKNEKEQPKKTGIKKKTS